MSFAPSTADSGYAAIGGGASPFLTGGLNISVIMTGNLTLDCQRHTRKTRRRTSRRTVPFYYYHGTYRLGQLFCRTGFHLQIHDNGKVNGTKRDDSGFGVLEFLSVAFGLVSIRGKASQKFLCMSSAGKLYGSKNYTKECVFMEKMLENYYNTYASCAYSGRKRRWYLSLNKRGRTRRGRKTRKKKRYTHFLVLHLDDEDFKGNSWRVSAVEKIERSPGQRTRFGLNHFAKNWRERDSAKYQKMWKLWKLKKLQGMSEKTGGSGKTPTRRGHRKRNRRRRQFPDL